MMIIKTKTIHLLLLFLHVLLFDQQALSQVDDVARRASIDPSIVTLEPGQAVDFKVLKKSAVWRPSVFSSAVVAENVIWSVNGIVGGNTEFGTIDKNGLFTAPRNTSSPREISIMGEIDGVQNKKLFATVKVNPKEPCYETVYQYSEPVNESEYFDTPHGLTFDRNGNIVIVDESRHHVVRFSRDGRFLGYIGDGKGERDGQFYRPRTVILDETSGDLYISDQKESGNRIQVFTNEGKLKKTFAPHGHSDGEFNRIHGMNFDSNGNIFVVDVDNHRVSKLSNDGEYIFSWGEKGIYGNQLNEPHGLVVDPNDDVFVSSYYGTIKKFDAQGNYLFSFAEANPPKESVYIHAISSDKWGNIYSMTRGIDGFGGQFEINKDALFSIEKFNNNGDFVCGVNLSVHSHSEIWAIVDEEDGYIYAVYRSPDTAGFEILAPR